MKQADDPRRNRLLASLTDADLQRWLPHLSCVDLTQAQVLHASGRPQTHAFFPTTAVISKLCTLASGDASEVAFVGSEGVVGVSLLLGGATSITYSEVLVPGRAFRIGAAVFQQTFELSAAARGVLLLYVQAFMTQVAQAAICNRFHTIEQRVCGLLLHTLDRLDGDAVDLTQEGVATMLGVRRESVTAAVGQLRSAALVRVSRGHIEVRDRNGLARRSCECHAVVKDEYDRLLPRPAQTASLAGSRRSYSRLTTA